MSHQSRIVSIDHSPPMPGEGCLSTERRLERAVVGLAAVTHRQKQHTAAFRDTVALLKREVGALEQTLRDYSAKVETLDVTPLGRRARRLVRILDGF